MLTKYQLSVGLRSVRNLKIYNMSLLKNALIGGGVNLATSAFNSWLSGREAKRQYDRQIDFWEKQNLYNSPLEQRRRLEQAGFNPVAAVNEVASSQAAGELSSVPRNEVNANGFLNPEALNNSIALLGQMEQVGANTDLLKRQVELSFIQEVIMNAEAYGLELDNEKKKKLLDWVDKEKEISIQKMLSEIKNLDSESAVNTQNIENLKQAIKESEQRIAESKSAQAYNEALTKTEDSTRPLKEALMSAQTENEKASAAEAYASARCKNILATLDEQYGSREREAALGSAESAAAYADAINAAAVELSKSAKELNDANAYTGKARIEIEQAAQELKEKYYDIDKNRFALEAVTQGSDSVAKIIDALLPG